uniref:SH3 domain binding glutamate-rich protein like 3 n=1 Tax=Astyanax mexicanus TaxID=7994 RepID=A0A3B1IXJ1_ASTMX
MSIVVYFSSASGSREVKQRQSEIFQFLDSKKIIYRALDITQSSDVKDEMRRKVGNNTALPPQIFNGDKYCGVSLFTRSFSGSYTHRAEVMHWTYFAPVLHLSLSWVLSIVPVFSGMIPANNFCFVEHFLIITVNIFTTFLQFF